MNDRMKYNNKKSMFIICLFWLANLLVAGNFAYAQTGSEVSTPVEILMADPELVGSSATSVLFAQAKKYHDGDNVAQDFVKARELYLQAAQIGSNDAKVNLGYLYFMGEGVGQDYEKARNWYLSAAKNGSKDAQLNLAMIYQNGFGVFKDNTKAKYWRTYGQVKSTNKKPNIKPVMPTPKKIVAVKPKPIVNQVKSSQPSTLDTKQLNTIKPKTVIAQLNENKLKPEAKPEIATDPVITIAQATQSVPKSQILTPQATDNKLGISNINAANPKDLVASIPQAQMLTTQAKDGLNGINDTIAALNKEAILPAPIRALRSRPRQEGKSSQVLSPWFSNIIAAFMLALVMITCFWFFTQYTKIGKQKKAQVFARAFYAHHRDRLRINYLHYPIKHRKVETIDDSWAAVLCVLMVKFAQSQQDEETLVGMQSNKIIQALKESPLKAKQAVFPFVKVTQHRIFEDIEAHECNFNGAADNDGETQMAGPPQAPENRQPTEVKLQSDSCEKQAPLLKESSSSEITD